MNFNLNAKPSYRLLRINALIKCELMKLLAYTSSDPKLKLVKITEVSVNKDLSMARVFFNLDDDNARAQVTESLSKAKFFFRKHLARQLELRRTPALIFIYDTTLKTAEHIDKLLKKLKTH